MAKKKMGVSEIRGTKRESHSGGEARQAAGGELHQTASGHHLKAIAADKGAQALLKIANIGHDAGVVSANDESAFIAAAKTRQWSREKSVRTLA